MSLRMSPLWWPVLAVSSPVLLPVLFTKNRKFTRNLQSAKRLNSRRIAGAGRLRLPELAHLTLSVVVEHKTAPGFVSSPAVSYVLESDLGRVLFDAGYGPEDQAMAVNSKRLRLAGQSLDGVIISHLHPDHMGGFAAVKESRLILTGEIAVRGDLPCYLAADATAERGVVEVVSSPRQLVAGFGTTGPLARSLFLMGWVEEQAIVARLKGKGLVIITGCGHPTIEVIVKMVRKLSGESIYAIVGGLHFPVTDSPLRKAGVKAQMIWGTGKPPWQRITDEDLTETIDFIRSLRPQKLLLSGHDSCDHALGRFCDELPCETQVLEAGRRYEL